MHYLALTFLAGLDEVERTEPAELSAEREHGAESPLLLHGRLQINDANGILGLDGIS